MGWLFIVAAVLIASFLISVIGVLLLIWGISKLKNLRKKYKKISSTPQSWNIWFLLILGGVFVLQGIFVLGSFLLANT